jgi:hypothetical protein
MPALCEPVATQEAGIEISRVHSKLDKLDRLMDKAKTDREWDNLSRAYERLFKVWCWLTATPGPGQLRPTGKGRRATLLPPPLPEQTPEQTNGHQDPPAISG